MFVACATDDFVNVLQPTYSTYRAFGFLWMVFLIVIRVLLLNLVLDTLVAAYTETSEKFEKKETNEKVEGIRRAFETFAKAGQANSETIHTHEEGDFRLSKDEGDEFGASPIFILGGISLLFTQGLIMRGLLHICFCCVFFVFLFVVFRFDTRTWS